MTRVATVLVRVSALARARALVLVLVLAFTSLPQLTVGAPVAQAAAPGFGAKLGRGTVNAYVNRHRPNRNKHRPGKPRPYPVQPALQYIMLADCPGSTPATPADHLMCPVAAGVPSGAIAGTRL